MVIDVGIVQMNSSESYEDNLAFSERMIAEAAERKLNLLAFPETFLYVGNDHSAKHDVAEKLETDILPRFSQLAKQSNCALLLGSVYEITDENSGRLFNTSIFIDRDGSEKARY
jgi:predicted amidohydrolase